MPAEPRVVQRNFALAAFLLSLVPAVPACLLAALVMLNSVNPMQTMFISSFRVRNESHEVLRFWVVGRHESGALDLLPLFATSFPAFPSIRIGGFSLAEGETRTITYDWDDHDITAIVVRRANGELRAVDVDADAGRDECCSRHRREEYVLPVTAAMRPATDAERAACRGTGAFDFRLITIGMLPLLSYGLYRLQRGLRAGYPAAN